jgi:hypothetical protein
MIWSNVLPRASGPGGGALDRQDVAPPPRVGHGVGDDPEDGLDGPVDGHAVFDGEHAPHLR